MAKLIDDLNNLLRQFEKIAWVDKVKPKWHPPEGLFTEDPQTIAKTIAKASRDYRQAVARVNFFYNRYGCSHKRKNDPICKKREKVLRFLRKLFKIKEEESMKVVVTYDGNSFDVIYPSGSVKSFSDEVSFLKFATENKIRDENGITGQQLIDLVKEAGYIEVYLG